MKIIDIRTDKFQDELTIIVHFDNNWRRSMVVRLHDHPEAVAYAMIELGKYLLDDMYEMTRQKSPFEKTFDER